MRIFIAYGLIIGLQCFPTIASASGAHSCCLIDRAFNRSVYQSRASSRFKGTIDDLCRAAARDQKSRRCDAKSTIR